MELLYEEYYTIAQAITQGLSIADNNFKKSWKPQISKADFLMRTSRCRLVWMHYSINAHNVKKTIFKVTQITQKF
jgi:hypothetical protein